MSMYDENDPGESPNTWTPDGATPGMDMPVQNERSMDPYPPDENGQRNMGPPPVARDMAQKGIGQVTSEAGQKMGQDIQTGVQNAQNSGPVQLIMKYLQGGDTAAPEDAKTIVKGVKHEFPGVNDSDANLLAVDVARKMGGPAAAWQMVQYNRNAYNAKNSFTKAALNGVDGKAGDMAAAADAATEAATHILDGSSATFTALPGGQGFTATVTIPGTDKKISRVLSPQQFAELTDIGKAGQYDRLMETGSYVTALMKLAGGNYGKNGPQSQEEEDAKGPQQVPATDTMNPEATPTPGTPLEATATEGKFEGPAPKPESDTDEDGRLKKSKAAGNATGGMNDVELYGNRRVQQSYNIFGEGNVGHEAARQAWLEGRDNEDRREADKLEQSKAGIEGKKAVAEITGRAGLDKENAKGGWADQRQRTTNEGKQGVADTQSAARVEAARLRANAIIKQMEMKASSEAEKQRIQVLKLEVNDPNVLIRNGSFEDVMKKHGVRLNGPLLPNVAPPTGKPESAPAVEQSDPPVPPLNERVTGKTYKSDKGRFTWMGNAWKPAD